MRSKIWFLQFIGLLLVGFACTAKKTTLDQYFEGVIWEEVNSPGHEIKISNCRYQYKGELGEATTRLQMIDDKRIRLAHQDGDTFFVSVLNLAGKNFLVLHDSLRYLQFFKSDRSNKFPALDNHDKVDLSFLDLGVSIGQTIPISLLQNPVQEYTPGQVKTLGIKRSGQTVNGERVFADLSAENRILEIRQYYIPDGDIPDMVHNINEQIGFSPRIETVDISISDEDVFIEKKFVWKLIGLTISLYSNFYLDNEKNQKRNLAGKRKGNLIIRDDFLTQAEIFKANYLDQN